jgi:hypothetical protein
MAETTEEKAGASRRAAKTGEEEQAPGSVKVTFSRDFTLTGIREVKDGEATFVERQYSNGETADIPPDLVDQVLMYGHAMPEDPELARRYGLGQGPRIGRRSEEKKEG